MCMAGIAEGKLNPADAEIYENACNNGGAKERARWPIYYYGERVKQDYAKATKLYDKACELKSPIGCAFLGAFYRDGRGVAQSYEKAAEIFTKACEIDSGNGCYDLAELHEGRPRRRARHKNGDEISRQSLRARRPQGLR